MSASAVAVPAFLAIGAGACVIGSLGVLLMRDAYQRLNFQTLVVTFGSVGITVAVFIQDTDATMRVKAVFVAALLFFMNGVLSHITARAIYIRKTGRWFSEKPEAKG